MFPLYIHSEAIKTILKTEAFENEIQSKKDAKISDQNVCETYPFELCSSEFQVHEGYCGTL